MEQQELPKENQELLEQIQSVPHPIFLGTDNGILIKTINDLVLQHNAEHNENYEIALLNPAMYNSNAQLYFMQKLSPETKSAFEKQTKDNEMRNELLSVLINVKNYMVTSLKSSSEEVDEMLYKGYDFIQWRDIIRNTYQKRLTNKHTQDVLNGFVDYGFGMCMNPTEKNKSRRFYCIVKDDSNVLQELSERIEILMNQKLSIQAKIDEVNNKIVEISKKLDDEAKLMDQTIQPQNLPENDSPILGQHRTGNPVIDSLAKAGENMDVQHLKSPIISAQDAEAIEYLDKVKHNGK